MYRICSEGMVNVKATVMAAESGCIVDVLNNVSSMDVSRVRRTGWPEAVNGNTAQGTLWRGRGDGREGVTIPSPKAMGMPQNSSSGG